MDLHFDCTEHLHGIVSYWRKAEKALERLKEISQAVIEGRFNEDVWMLNGKVVKSRGIIEVDGKTRTIGAFLTFFNPYRRKRQQHFNYAPYVSPEHGEIESDSL